MVWYDKTTGQYVDSSAIEVQPGQSFIMQCTSTGDDMVLVAVTQTLAQWNAQSTTGDGNGSITDPFDSAGTSALVAQMAVIPYLTMQPVSSGVAGPTQIVGSSQLVGSGSPGAPSGATVSDVINGTTGNANGTGAVGVAAPTYSGGTATNQTGNTAAVTNGVYNLGVNALVQQVGNGVIAEYSVGNALANILLGTQNVDVDNFPGNQTVTVSNWPSGLGGGSVTFPSSMNVTGTVNVGNFPSSLGGGGFPSGSYPSSLDVLNFPSNYPDAAALADLDAIKYALGVGGSFDPGSAVAAAEAAGASVVGGTNWGSTVGGSVGGVGVYAMPATMPSAFPAGTIGSTPIGLTFDPVGSIWASASSLMLACKSLIALAMCVAFTATCGKAMQVYVVGLLSSPQQMVLAGVEDNLPGIAQAKMVASATAVTAAAAAALSALLALVDGSLSSAGGSLSISTLTGNIDYTNVGSGLALVNTYFPCLLLVQLGVLRAAFYFWTAPVYAAAAATIRFISV
jgi:hypothetical protein